MSAMWLRVAVLVFAAFGMMLAGCAGASPRKTEKDLIREYRVVYAGNRLQAFATIAAKLDQISQDNGMVDNKRDIDPARNHIGYALQIKRSNAPDLDALFYAIDIGFSEKEYRIDFTLWPQVAAGSHVNAGIVDEDLVQAYAAWRGVAGAIASATGGHAQATSISLPVH